MKGGETDPGLRCFERDAVIACLVMAAAALALQQGRPDGAAGVLAGGALMAISYRAIKGGVATLIGVARRVGEDRAARAAAPEGEPCEPTDVGDGASASEPPSEPAPPPDPVLSPRARVAGAVKFLSRYALLAIGAYAMLTCLRLHPVGVMAGVASPFVAAAMQVARLSRASSRRDRP